MPVDQPYIDHKLKLLSVGISFVFYHLHSHFQLATVTYPQLIVQSYLISSVIGIIYFFTTKTYAYHDKTHWWLVVDCSDHMSDDWLGNG